MSSRPRLFQRLRELIRLQSTRLVPLAVLRLHYTTIQIGSNYPTFTGAFATVTIEMYLALGVVCLVTAFFKSFITAYEDNAGISYTEGGSGSGSKSRKPSATIRLCHKFLSGSSTSGGLRGWEREEDQIIDPTDAGLGLQILKTVQLSVRNEYIELRDHGTAFGAEERNWIDSLYFWSYGEN